MEEKINFEGIEKELLGSQSVENENQVLEMIRARVSELLDKDPELLMSYLYRLDVLEKDLKVVLGKESKLPIAEGFSQLIFNRQMQRVATKRKFKQDPIEGWEY